jgi:hypothetical protein
VSNKYSIRAAIAAIVVLGFALSGCEVILPKQHEVKEEVLLKKYQGIPLNKLLTDLQNKFKKAKDESLYFYSPENYRTARTSIQAARAHFRDKEKKTYVLKKIYLAEQALKDAYEVKAIVRRELPEFIELHNSLFLLEAKKTHTREYRAMTTTMDRLIRRIEAEKEALFKDKDKKARFEEDKQDIIAQLKDFRMRVVKYKYLNHGEQLIAEAESKDARNIAPVTYGAVIKQRKEAVAYIENNVNNLEGIQQVSDQFEFAATRLMHITREVFNVVNLEPNTQEEYVLRQEKRLKRIADAFKAGDLRDQSFREQAAQLAENAKHIVKQKEDLALQVAELRSSGSSGQSAAEQQDDSPSVEAIAQQQAAAAQRGNDVVVPVTSGDPEQMKKSVRQLTDQIYKLIIENDQLKGKNMQLQNQVEKLQTELTANNAPAKSKTANDEADDKKPENKKTGNEKTTKKPEQPASGKPDAKVQPDNKVQ